MADAKSTRARNSRSSPKRVLHARSVALPDLSKTLTAFLNGLALVTAAHMAMRYADQSGPPEVALRDGIEALTRVYDDFDRADVQLRKAQRRIAAKGKAS